MDFYEAILLYKIQNKTPFRALGEPIGLSPDAIRMALNRKSLSTLQMKVLGEVFGIETEKSNDNVSNVSNHGNSRPLPPLNNYYDIDIISYINKHKDRFIRMRSFRMLIESLTLDDYIEDVRREVDQFIESYQESHPAK